jgi:hypothetical protein
MPNKTNQKFNRPIVIFLILAVGLGLVFGYYIWKQPEESNVVVINNNSNTNQNTNTNVANVNGLLNDNLNINSNQNANTAIITNAGNAAELNDLIRLADPKANDIIGGNPIVGRGQARGSWFFEASFPVRLEDANGRVLAQTQAQAEGDWMTSDFVSFTFSLSFQLTHNQSYWLVLERDNPSGQPSTTQALRVPVRTGNGIR